MNKTVKRKEMLLKLEQEVKDLEKQIKKARFEGIRIAGVKSLKVFGHISVAALPIVLSTALVVGGGYLLDVGLPFILDDKNQKENIKKEFDSRNAYRIERHYADLEQNNQIVVTSNWLKNDEGMYQRQIDKYTFGKYNEDDIINVINSGNLTSIVEIIGTPYSYIEKTKELTEQQAAENDKYLQAILYSVSNDNVRVVKENAAVNVNVTIIEMFLLLLIGRISATVVWSESGYDPIWKIKCALRDTKSNIDVKSLTKQLQSRKENLQRIRG